MFKGLQINCYVHDIEGTGTVESMTTGAAGAQVPQPRPRPLRQVRHRAAQLGGQTADDYRVVEVGPVAGEVLAFAGVP
jgi:hypothetical protein